MIRSIFQKTLRCNTQTDFNYFFPFGPSLLLVHFFYEVHNLKLTNSLFTSLSYPTVPCIQLILIQFQFHTEGVHLCNSSHLHNYKMLVQNAQLVRNTSNHPAATFPLPSVVLISPLYINQKSNLCLIHYSPPCCDQLPSAYLLLDVPSLADQPHEVLENMLLQNIF